MAKIAVYLADFNPVHLGHLEFALKARDKYLLNRIYFLPERNLSNNEYYVHLGHRVSMLRQALRPHKNFKILELDYRFFTINKTLPKIKEKFYDDEIYLLMDYKTYLRFKATTNQNSILDSFKIILGLSSKDKKINLMKVPGNMPDIIYQKNLMINKQIQRALFKNKFNEAGLLKSVVKYCVKNWVYILISD